MLHRPSAGISEAPGTGRTMGGPNGERRRSMPGSGDPRIWKISLNQTSEPWITSRLPRGRGDQLARRHRGRQQPCRGSPACRAEGFDDVAMSLLELKLVDGGALRISATRRSVAFGPHAKIMHRVASTVLLTPATLICNSLPIEYT